MNCPLRIRISNYVPTIHAPTIILSQNRWWTQLVIKLVHLSNEKSPMCSHQVPNAHSIAIRLANMFPKFPITPHFVAYVLPHIVLLEPICYKNFVNILGFTMFLCFEWIPLFWGVSQVYLFDPPKFHKNLWCANQKILLQPKTFKLESTPN